MSYAGRIQGERKWLRAKRDLKYEKGNHMKSTKLFGIIVTGIAGLSVLSAQTKPSNPSVRGNNPPSVPGPSGRSAR